MKFFSSMLATLILAMSLTYSRGSQAAVGVIATSPAILIGGLALAGTGGTVYLLTRLEDSSSSQGIGEAVGFLFGLIALMVLDEKNQEITFNEMSLVDAQKLKVTAEEMTAYNSEIDQINFLTAEVSQELSDNSSVRDSAKIWESKKEYLSPEAFSAMVKISEQIVK